MSANIVAEWRDARLGLPFLFTVERVGRGRGERELGREKTRRRFHPPHRRAEGGPLLSCEKWFPVGRAVLKEMKNQGHGR